MPAQLNGLVAPVRQALAGFTTGQKAITALAVVGLLAGGLFFSSWASKPSYAPLYTDLEASDAAAITEALGAQGVGYELADGGRTILVPRNALYQTRLEMSAAGLPEGGTQGYALLDEQGITASEFRQRVDYQRALEGELTRTITAIAGVDAAKVHLVIPEEDLFADDQRQPTASVLVKMKPGKELAPGQVRSIVHLVSTSVEGLVPEQITVADADGTMLAAPGQEGMTAAANDVRAQQTAAFEADLARSVQQLLEPVAGAGGAIVRVKADLDFDQRSTRTERYETAEGVPPLTEATTTETYEGIGAPVGGVLGPDAVPLAPGDATSSYTKEQVQRANAVGTVVEELESAPGQVRRMSVAVLLDGDGDALDEAAVRDLVMAATLLDPERGDELEVATMAFDTTAADAAAAELAEAQEAQRQAELMELVRTVGIVAVVGLVLLFAYRSNRKHKRQAMALHDDDVLARARELLALEADGADQLTAGLPTGAARALEPAALRRMEVQTEVAELVDRQPEEVAQLLRGWLADRRAS